MPLDCDISYLDAVLARQQPFRRLPLPFAQPAKRSALEVCMATPTTTCADDPKSNGSLLHGSESSLNVLSHMKSFSQ